MRLMLRRSTRRSSASLLLLGEDCLLLAQQAFASSDAAECPAARNACENASVPNLAAMRLCERCKKMAKKLS
jgi:hypothetical protein